jgi:hypothetical protein
MKQIIPPGNNHTITALMKGDNPVGITDKIIQGEFVVNNDNYQCRGLQFENCEFENLLAFTDVDLGVGVKFIDCLFKGRVLFGTVIANDINDNFNRNGENVYFENCRILKEVRFVGTEIGRDVHFKNCPEIERIAADQSIMHQLHVEGCTANNLDIHALDAHFGIRIEKSTITGQGRYAGCRGGGFSFLNSNFSRDQYIWGGNVRSVVTNNGIFEDDLKIHAVTATEGYTLFGTIFKKGVSIPLIDTASKIVATVNTLFLENCDFQGGFEFSSDNSTSATLNCTNLTIRRSTLLKGNLSFETANIGKTTIAGTNSSANLSFRNTQINQIAINHFTNLGKLYFADVNALASTGSIFSINKTALGTSIFLNVDLSGFEKVIIKHSHLTDILFTDVKWFSTKQLNPTDTFNETIMPGINLKFRKDADLKAWSLVKTNKEVYRQLKYAATKQGDAVQSLIFQGEEMNEFNKELDFYAFRWKSIGNRTMMLINRSNDYGNNWVKPIVLLLSLNLLFFFLITVAQSEQFYWHLSFRGEDCRKTWDLLSANNGAYWSILNPVRRLSDIYEHNKKPFDGTTIFWDYFSRIFVSYFLFQIVSAFRKYSK